MKDEQDYIRDIMEMRSMMERSSKFMSLSGLAGIMAGLYALAGAYIAYSVLKFNPQINSSNFGYWPDMIQIVLLAVIVLVISIATAFFLSYKKANQRKEKFWNATSRRLLINMSVPLITGGILALIFISKGMIGFLVPFTLMFYGLALFNASKFTYNEVRSLGIIEIVLGLISSYFTEYGLFFWAAGFGLVHIVYGIYMHYRYEK